MNPIEAHCNKCGGERDHAILHAEKTLWHDEEQGIYGADNYETLKCLGCRAIKLRHTSSFSEDEEPVVNYFPPAIFRPQPEWFQNRRLELSFEEKFVEKLLKEIYIALQNNLPSLAAMGVRSLIEKVMISKISDQGNFASNMEAFEKRGYVSRMQRERMEAILDAGHATIHGSSRQATKMLSL